MDACKFRRHFFAALFSGLKVVWPVLSGLLAAIVVLGVTIGFKEGWSVGESIYFAFVSGLTIGYGDFSPKSGLGRTLAVLIGVCGVLLTALLAAVAVRAFTTAQEGSAAQDPHSR